LAGAPINRRLSFNRSPQPINGLSYDTIEMNPATGRELTFRRSLRVVAITIGSACGEIDNPGSDVARAFLESLY
jgi:hypothetical protein